MKAVNIKDAYGDRIILSLALCGPPWLVVECLNDESGRAQTQIALTPAQARRVAKALMKFAEGE